MKMDFTGKTALVTGGARGIGAAVSRALAGAGAKVVINYAQSADAARQLCDELASGGLSGEIFQADVSDAGQVEALFNHIRQSCGRLDILINNAGIVRDGLLLTMPLPDWEKVHDVNLRGAFLTTRMAGELMVMQRSGKIVNIASVSAIRGGRGQVNYASAKGGLVAFTRACAVELAPKNIQVNAVLPGVIETQMSSRIRKRAGEQLLERIPSQRYGSPEEVADLVLFLASDKSDYITGQAIAVDGGLSIS